MASQTPGPTGREPPEKEKNMIDDLYKYGKTNPRDIIAYAVMIVGILLTFFIPFVGGLLIGIVGALYFADDILNFIVNIKTYIARLGSVKSLLAAGVALGLLLQAPGMVIGAAIVVTVRYALENK